MTEQDSDKPNTKRTADSEVVTTRVNVAFPFSAIRIQEPSEDHAAPAGLVSALTEHVADVVPGPKAQELRKRAHALSTRLA